MKVLVTGGAGFLGSVCVSRLLAAGHEACVYDDLSQGSLKAVPEGGRLEIGDLLDRTRLLNVFASFRPEAVIHLAGPSGMSVAMTAPSPAYRVQLEGGLHILDAMVANGCRTLVYASSSSVYGMPDKIPVDERLPLKPTTVVGHAKQIFEQIAAWYEKAHGLAAVGMRCFNLAGATECHGEARKHETHLMPVLFRVAKGTLPSVPIYGKDHATPDGTCIRDYLHVADAADAFVKALARTQGAVYNLGSGEGFTVLQIVEFARKLTGHSIHVEMLPSRPGEPGRLVAGANRAKIELGWQPARSKIHEILQSAWEWHLRHPQGYGE